MAKAPVVAVLARAPSAGDKRRLFAALGREPDTALLQALLLDTLDGVLSAGYATIVGVEPPSAVEEVRALVPGDVRVVPQAEGDLGARMHALMKDAFSLDASAVVLVGSDLPDLSAGPIRDAVGLLADDPATVVLGPAADGGYYLIGAGRVPEVFDGIDWGTAAVLAQTEQSAARKGLVCRRVDTQHDVDRPSDLARVRGARTRAWVDGNP